MHRLVREEERLGEAEGLLRLMASRLSLAAEGRDPEIDDAVRHLRKTMRKGLDYEGMRTTLERISQRMFHLEDDPPVTSANAVPLLSLLERVDWPSACAEQAEDIRKRLAGRGGDVAEAVDAIARLIAQASAAEASTAEGNEGEQAASLLEMVVTVFLERLDLGPELNERARRIGRSSADGLTPDILRKHLDALADLVTERIAQLRRQCRDMGGFLSSLSQRLSEVEQHINAFTDSSSSSLSDTRELGANMREQVQYLSSSVQDADDLEQLKLTVRGRLDNLLERVNSYCVREEARSQELEVRVKSMSGRLRALENEGNELRGLLTAEHLAATTDALTGVPNRAAYDVCIEQEFQRWQRVGGALSLVVLDVDYFKRVNDVYGHRAGDKALAMLAQVMRAKVRDTDFFARYGGEEFVLILPGTDQQSASTVAEKLREAVHLAPFHYRGERVELTVSGGIAAFREEDKPASVFERADRALYLAKQNGRNRCEIEA